MRTGRHATFAKISKLVDVETVLSRCQSGHLSCDIDVLALNLYEFRPSADTRAIILIKYANSVVYRCWRVFELMHSNMLIRSIL